MVQSDGTGRRDDAMIADGCRPARPPADRPQWRRTKRVAPGCRVSTRARSGWCGRPVPRVTIRPCAPQAPIDRPAFDCRLPVETRDRQVWRPVPTPRRLWGRDLRSWSPGPEDWSHHIPDFVCAWISGPAQRGSAPPVGHGWRRVERSVVRARAMSGSRGSSGSICSRSWWRRAGAASCHLLICACRMPHPWCLDPYCVKHRGRRGVRRQGQRPSGFPAAWRRTLAANGKTLKPRCSASPPAGIVCGC
jgi:hypothetical protein